MTSIKVGVGGLTVEGAAARTTPLVTTPELLLAFGTGAAGT